MSPGFSERTFEFCFNAEYCQINSGILATHPHIPSQNQEKDLGYDVEFLIRTREFTTSVFFQHKVPYFAEQRAGRNARFFDAHGGPYFRFGVDRDQHNLLYDLSIARGNTYYCSPCYNVSTELAQAYRTVTVAQRSLLLDPFDVGRITDDERHNTTYSPSGDFATLHSESRSFEHSFRGAGERAPRLKPLRVTLDMVSEHAEELSRRVDAVAQHGVEEARSNRTDVQYVQVMLGRVYRTSWILLQ